MRPSEYTELIEDLLARAGIAWTGIGTYSLRRTVGNEVERPLGRTVRDLILHGCTTGRPGISTNPHALRDRRHREVRIDGRPYGKHTVWAEMSRTGRDLVPFEGATV